MTRWFELVEISVSWPCASASFADPGDWTVAWTERTEAAEGGEGAEGAEWTEWTEWTEWAEWAEWTEGTEWTEWTEAREGELECEDEEGDVNDCGISALVFGAAAAESGIADADPDARTEAISSLAARPNT